MRRGQHMTDEQRERVSVAHKGHTPSDKTKKRMSEAMEGRIYSLEHRANISAAKKGCIVSPETRAKISVTIRSKGKAMTEEERKERQRLATQKYNASEKGIEHHAAYRTVNHEKRLEQGNAKRRGLGFIPLNTWTVGHEGHHVDPEQVIFIPKALHQSMYHSVKSGKNMAQMNAIAYNYLFKQEAEAAIAAKEQS